MSNPFDAVTTYFLAKDCNRPALMRRAFAPGVELQMVVKTDAISFPESAKGVAAVEDILGRRFANDFENIYTFGLARPTPANRRHFPCHWLVGMSAKNDGPIRVGCGYYDWYFTPDERCLVDRLVITIDVMEMLPAIQLDTIMAWLTGLPYPWCTPEDALRTMPCLEGLSTVRSYLSQAAPMAPEI